MEATRTASAVLIPLLTVSGMELTGRCSWLRNKWEELKYSHTPSLCLESGLVFMSYHSHL